WVVADSEQLTEVILTLASGAHESAQERTMLTVGCSMDPLAELTSGATLVPGKYARIRMRDDGRGVESGKLAGLFETLLPDRDPAGPRSAISWAYMLVREWGGDIAVENVSPHGTAFSIYLPLVEPEPAAEVPAPPPMTVEPPVQPPPQPELLRETILVV